MPLAHRNVVPHPSRSSSGSGGASCPQLETEQSALSLPIIMHHLTGNIVAVNDCEQAEQAELEEEWAEESRPCPRLDLCARPVMGVVPPLRR